MYFNIGLSENLRCLPINASAALAKRGQGAVKTRRFAGFMGEGPVALHFAHRGSGDQLYAISFRMEGFAKTLSAVGRVSITNHLWPYRAI